MGESESDSAKMRWLLTIVTLQCTLRNGWGMCWNCKPDGGCKQRWNRVLDFARKEMMSWEEVQCKNDILHWLHFPIGLLPTLYGSNVWLTSAINERSIKDGKAYLENFVCHVTHLVSYSVIAPLFSGQSDTARNSWFFFLFWNQLAIAKCIFLFILLWFHFFLAVLTSPLAACPDFRRWFIIRSLFHSCIIGVRAWYTSFFTHAPERHHTNALIVKSACFFQNTNFSTFSLDYNGSYCIARNTYRKSISFSNHSFFFLFSVALFLSTPFVLHQRALLWQNVVNKIWVALACFQKRYDFPLFYIYIFLSFFSFFFQFLKCMRQ